MAYLCRFSAIFSRFSETSDNTTYTFTMPAQDVSVSATFEENSPILYKMDVTGVKKDEQVSYSLNNKTDANKDVDDTDNVTAADMQKCDVADFGEAPGDKKYTQVEALDGWGYKHYCFTKISDNVKRQSHVNIVKATNTVNLYNPGNQFAKGILSFIPEHAGITLPTDETYIYAFELVFKADASDKDKTCYFGLTTNKDATQDVTPVKAASVGATTTEQVIPVGIIVDPKAKTYKYVIDGAADAGNSGNYGETAPTGIYVAGNGENSPQGLNIGIRNLVIVKGEPQKVTLNYKKYAEGDNTAIEGKAATQVDWLTNAPFVVPASARATFEAETADTTRYILKEANNIDKVSSTNASIDVIFDAHDYQEVTFTVKVDDGEVQTPTKDVSIKVTGTAKCDSTVKVDKTVVTTDGGTASIKLLPASDESKYTYAIALAPNEYKAKTGTFNVGDENVEIVLDKDVQEVKAADIDTSKLNSGTILGGQQRDIGYVSTIQYNDAEKSQEMVTPSENIVWTVKKGEEGANGDAGDEVTIGEEGKVSISGEANGTYQITAKIDETVDATPVTITIGTEGTEIIGVATDDFEGKRNIFDAPYGDTNGDYKTFGVYRYPLNNSAFTSVMIMAEGENTKEITLDNPIALGQNTVTFSTDIWAHYAAGNGNVKVELLTSDEEPKVVASWTINKTNDAKDSNSNTKAYIGGAEVGTTELKNVTMWCGTGTASRNNSNGWKSAQQPKTGENGTVSVSIDKDGKVTMTFENKNKSSASKYNLTSTPVTGNIDTTQYKDIAKIVFTEPAISGTSTPGNGTGYDNIKLEVTKAPTD